MQLVAPRAVRIADAIDAMICTIHFRVSFLVIAYLLPLDRLIHVAVATGIAACALAKQPGAYLTGLTVLYGDSLHQRLSASPECSAAVSLSSENLSRSALNRSSGCQNSEFRCSLNP